MKGAARAEDTALLARAPAKSLRPQANAEDVKMPSLMMRITAHIFFDFAPQSVTNEYFRALIPIDFETQALQNGCFIEENIMNFTNTIKLSLFTLMSTLCIATTASADKPEGPVCNPRNCDPAVVSTAKNPICPEDSCDPIPTSDMPDPECQGADCGVEIPKPRCRDNSCDSSAMSASRERPVNPEEVKPLCRYPNCRPQE